MFRVSGERLSLWPGIFAVGWLIVVGCFGAGGAVAMPGEFKQRVFLVDSQNACSEVTLAFLPSLGECSSQREGKQKQIAHYQQQWIQDLLVEEQATITPAVMGSASGLPVLQWTELLGYALILHQRNADPKADPEAEPGIAKRFQVRTDDPVFAMLEDPGLLAGASFSFSCVEMVPLPRKPGHKARGFKSLSFRAESIDESELEVEVIIMDGSVHGLAIREEITKGQGFENLLVLSSMELGEAAEQQGDVVETETEFGSGSDGVVSGDESRSEEESYLLDELFESRQQLFFENRRSFRWRRAGVSSMGDSSGESDQESGDVPRAKRRRLKSVACPVSVIRSSGAVVSSGPLVQPVQPSPK